MDIKLSAGENRLNSWDYSRTSKKSANLTITDKRIISTVQGKKGIKRKEMSIENVKSLNVAYGKPRIPGWLLALIIITFPMGGLGVLILIAWLIYARKKAFYLSFNARRVSGSEVGLSKTVRKKKTTKAKKGLIIALLIFAVACISGLLMYEIMSALSRVLQIQTMSVMFMGAPIIWAIVFSVPVIYSAVEKGNTHVVKLRISDQDAKMLYNEVGAAIVDARSA